MILMPMEKHSTGAWFLLICLLLTCTLLVSESLPALAATSGAGSAPSAGSYLQEAMNLYQNGSYSLASERINQSLQMEGKRLRHGFSGERSSSSWDIFRRLFALLTRL